VGYNPQRKCRPPRKCRATLGPPTHAHTRRQHPRYVIYVLCMYLAGTFASRRLPPSQNSSPLIAIAEPTDDFGSTPGAAKKICVCANGALISHVINHICIIIIREGSLIRSQEGGGMIVRMINFLWIDFFKIRKTHGTERVVRNGRAISEIIQKHLWLIMNGSPRGRSNMYRRGEGVGRVDVRLPVN